MKAVNCHEELVEGFEELMETWQCNPNHYQNEIDKYAPLISKAKGGAA